MGTRGLRPLHLYLIAALLACAAPASAQVGNFEWIRLGNVIRISTGVGSPEGAVVGNPGDEYFCSSSCSSIYLWVKATGTGTNTGWVGGGSVTTTGSPATGNLAKFSASGTITTANLSGDVTTSGTEAATIAANAVSNTKLRDSSALSVIGRSANSSGDPADITTSAASGAVLRESGSTIGFGTINTAGVADDAITFAKIENLSATRLLGRGSGGGTGDPEPIIIGSGLSLTGTTLNSVAGGGDVVGPSGSIDGEITLFDSTTGKLVKRATGTGVVHATSGVYSASAVALASEVTGDLALSNIAQSAAASRLLGRGDSGAGDWEAVTLGTNLSMSGTTLNASGGSGGPIESHAASTSTELTFTSCITSTYDIYKFVFTNVVPVTDGAFLYMQVSYDGGSTYDATSVYSYNYQYHGTGADAWQQARSTGTAQWKIAGTLENTANQGGANGSIELFNPLAATAKTYGGDSFFIANDGNFYRALTSGFSTVTTAVDAVRFYMDSGNITSGTIACYGIPK